MLFVKLWEKWELDKLVLTHTVHLPLRAQGHLNLLPDSQPFIGQVGEIEYVDE